MNYLVTGASRGIGLEFVNQLSSTPDNHVFALVRNDATRLEELNRSNIHIVKADLTDWKSIQAAVAVVNQGTGGRLDCLINNAAYIQDERMFHKLTDYTGQEDLLNKDFADNFQTNVVGTIHVINALIPLLETSPVKKVITLTSGLGDLDLILASRFAAHVPYSASKAALNMVMTKYAVQFRGLGWVFASISPGYVNTGLVPPKPEDIEAGIAMCDDFKDAAPWWDGQPLTAETSVREMLTTIARLSSEDSGAIVTRNGDKERWF